MAPLGGYLGLLTADLLAFDRHGLAWRLATRTVLALLLPLLAAQLLDRPVLVYMALAGFLVSIGDCVDDGDRQQVLRLAVGTIAGSMAIACGVLAGGSLVPALIGTLVWCAVAGLLGAYGNAFAAMGLPIAWAYVELGVPAAGHTPRHAATLAACWLGGGIVAFLLTQVVRIGGAHARLKERTAAVYRTLADYFSPSPPAAGGTSVVSPETRVRSAIAEARRVAEVSRRGQHGAEWQQQTLLIEIADRIFARAAVWREGNRSRSPDGERLAAIAHEVGRRILAGASAVGDGFASPGQDALSAEIAEELSRAQRVASGAVPAGSIVAAGDENRGLRLEEMLAPLRACLDRRSIIGRHALRFGLVTAAAVVVFWFFPPPFGFWIPLTVTVVLKPYAGVTLGRTIQRVLGTALGASLGTLLMPLLPGVVAQMIAVVIAFFCLMAVLPMNYSLAILFLSLGVVPFEHVLNPGLTLEIGLWRLAATAIGATLAIVGGHLLWPDFERRQLAGLLSHSLRSAARYAAAALGVTDSNAGQGALVAARRSAGMDTTNFHTTAQRSLSELDPEPIPQQGIVASAAILQRMMLVINAIANRAPDDPPIQSMAEIQATLNGLADGTISTADAVKELRRWRSDLAGKRPDDPLTGQVDALASQIELLATFEGTAGA